MTTIALKIGVSCNPEQALSAINTIEGLSKWWTTDTRGDASQGGIIQFLFNGEGPSMEVVKSTEDTVIWKCLKGHDEWEGTELEFKVVNGRETEIYFQHRNWPKGESEMFHHCSMKWGVFMLSLKDYLDGGEGKAFPNDIHVSTFGY